MNGDELVWRTVAVICGLIAAVMVWLGLRDGLDLGWLFISAFFVVVTGTVWKNA